MEVEEEEVANEGEGRSTSSGSVNRAPYLRGTGLNFQTMDPTEYDSQCWPLLKDAVTQLLTVEYGDMIPLSYEQTYSCVYRCVCRGLPERLYTDVIALIESHLNGVVARLSAEQEPQAFVLMFRKELRQYAQALAGIVPIFNYMNRFYVETRLRTSLGLQLKKMFCDSVVDPLAVRLMTLLDGFEQQPFALPPDTVGDVVKHLHELRPEYAGLRVELFARYVASLVPRTSRDDLPRYQEELALMQQQLVAEGYARGDQSRKRTERDDDEEGEDPSRKR